MHLTQRYCTNCCMRLCGSSTVLTVLCLYVWQRKHVFTFVAALGQEFDPEVVTPILTTVLPPLQREEKRPGKEDDLRQLAVEVMERLKKRVGVEAFSQVYTTAQTAHRQRKEKRKQKQAVDVS